MYPNCSRWLSAAAEYRHAFAMLTSGSSTPLGQITLGDVQWHAMSRQTPHR